MKADGAIGSWAGGVLACHQLADTPSGAVGAGVATADASALHQAASAPEASAASEGTVTMPRQTGQWMVDPALWVPIASVWEH
jgi:hypothetical protein